MDNYVKELNGERVVVEPLYYPNPANIVRQEFTEAQLAAQRGEAPFLAVPMSFDAFVPI